jgi:hypothetical protein
MPCPARNERVLGGSEFVERVLQRCAPAHQLHPRPDADAVLRKLCRRAAAWCRVRPEEIASRTLRRRALEARALVGWVAVRHYGFTLNAVARHLNVSIRSIARAVERGQRLREETPRESRRAPRALSKRWMPDLREPAYLLPQLANSPLRPYEIRLLTATFRRRSSAIVAANRFLTAF